MPVDLSAFRGNRVAARLFRRFVLFALLPVIGAGVVAVYEAYHTQQREAMQRLGEHAKDFGMEIAGALDRGERPEGDAIASMPVFSRLEDFVGPAHLYVTLRSGEFVVRSERAPPPVLAAAMRSARALDPTRAMRTRELHIVHEGQRYRAMRWNLVASGSLGGPDLVIWAWEPAPRRAVWLSPSQLMFPTVMLLAIVLAAWLAVRVIRQALQPLGQIVEGTRRIARRDFDLHLRVESDDEFAVVADSFNHMSRSLRRQFEATEALAEVDRLLLSSRGLETVLGAILPRVARVVGCEAVSVLLFESSSPGRARIFDHLSGLPESSPVRRFEYSRFVLLEALAGADQLDLSVEEAQRRFGFLSTLADYGSRRILVLLLRGELDAAGVLCLGFSASQVDADPQRDRHARELADRLSVALTNIAYGDALYQQAHYDSLTGLPNRALFHRKLEEAMRAAERDGVSGALLYVDLDHFKKVNDSAGHASGDALLRVMAERMRASCGPNDVVARLGGDEFAMLLLDAPTPDAVRATAERVLTSLARRVVVEGREHRTPGSIGVTLFPGDGRTVDDVLKHADIAMYRAKEAGRGRVVFFEAEMNAMLAARLELETGLQRAISEHGFELHYQPIVSAATQRIVGAEALLRWPKAPKHARSPADFMAVCEETGLIVPIGDWVIDAACSQLSAWHARGIPLPYLSVNVSPRQLLEDGFAGRVLQTLERHGVKPGALVLEITEGVLAEGATAARVLHALAASGIRLAIDDFGTGYSSLNYLRSFPIEIIKIDRSFVQDLPLDDQARTLVSTVVAMARGLRKTVVAEGVETLAQLEYLASIRCAATQGYLFTRPLPEHAFEAWIRQRVTPFPNDTTEVLRQA